MTKRNVMFFIAAIVGALIWGAALALFWAFIHSKLTNHYVLVFIIFFVFLMSQYPFMVVLDKLRDGKPIHDLRLTFITSLLMALFATFVGYPVLGLMFP